MTLADDARDAAAELSAAGAVHVATDPREVRVPGALLALRSVNYNTLDDTPEATWDLVLIGSAGSQHLALDSLGDQAAALSSHVEGGRFEARTIRDPNISPDPLPALVATIITE